MGIRYYQIYITNIEIQTPIFINIAINEANTPQKSLLHFDHFFDFLLISTAIGLERDFDSLDFGPIFF
jgi:hypothetical protein